MSRCAQCQGNNISSQGAGICTECSAGSAANADKTECGKFLLIFFPKQRISSAHLEIQEN